MVRASLGLLLALFAAAFWLTRAGAPPPPPAVGEGVFENVELLLFPKADPEARWRFSAREVRYDPKTRVARVEGLSEGARYVEDALDLTLQAKAIEIDRYDNLKTPQAVVEIPKECWKLYLEGEGTNPVRIDQARGFYAPRFRLEGPGVRVEGKGFRADFGLENASWRSGREEWQTGGEDACETTR